MKRNDRILCSLFLTLFLSLLYVSFSDFSLKCDDVRENSLRLHILANSDTKEDQKLKLKVRDEILSSFGDVMASCKGRSDAVIKLEGLKNDIEEAAIKVIRDNNRNYPVRVSLSNSYFDERNYENNVTMPAGRYDALKIEIGEAKGHNWWCVMYPPLCIPVYCRQDAAVLEADIRGLRSINDYEAKFALVEFGQKIAEWLRNR